MPKRNKIILFAIVVAIVATAIVLCVIIGGKKPTPQNQTAPLSVQPQNSPPQIEQSVPDVEQNKTEGIDIGNDGTAGNASVETIDELTDKITEAAANPVENKPDINPTSGTNPLRKVKTNPFE